MIGGDEEDYGPANMTMVQAVHANSMGSTYAAEDLEAVANNLYSVGLSKPAEQITEVVRQIRRLSSMVSRAYSKDLDQQLTHSQEMSGSLLRGIMAGVIGPPGRGEAAGVGAGGD